MTFISSIPCIYAIEILKSPILYSFFFLVHKSKSFTSTSLFEYQLSIATFLFSTPRWYFVILLLNYRLLVQGWVSTICGHDNHLVPGTQQLCTPHPRTCTAYIVQDCVKSLNLLSLFAASRLSSRSKWGSWDFLNCSMTFGGVVISYN